MLRAGRPANRWVKADPTVIVEKNVGPGMGCAVLGLKLMAEQITRNEPGGQATTANHLD